MAVSQFGVIVPDDVVDAAGPLHPTTPDDAAEVTRVDDVLTESPSGAVMAPETVTLDGDDVVLDVVDDAARAASSVIEPPAPFMTVGITWPAGGSWSPALQMRVRYTDGTWGEWFPLEASDADIDPAQAPEGREIRAASDPVWVGGADAAQIASIADAADAVPIGDVRLVTVSVAGPAGAVDVETSVAPAVYSGEATVESAAWYGPTVVTRAQWGARPAACTWNAAASLQAAVVHHTASQVGYDTPAQAINQLRADQAYHMDGRGWCDIGYNFVVDKFGTIYEGAAGSMERPVIGAHAAPFNTSTVGISVIGCYGNCASGNAALSDAAVNAVGRIAGWRLGQYGVSPGSTIAFDNGQQARTMPALVGHRDVNATACPGDNAYARLGDIRRVAAANVPPGVVYRAHVAGNGWLGWQRQGQTAGTIGQWRQAEGLALRAVNLPAGSGVECQAHSARLGWQAWVRQDQTCGTSGRWLRLEAFRLRLTGSITQTHRIWYRAYIAERGWLGWASNGATAGTTGFGLRVEAVQAVVLPLSAPAPGTTAFPSSARAIEYRAHAEQLWWMAPVRSGIAGTTGQWRRIEAISVRFPQAQPWTGSVECSANVKSLGWMDWVGAGSTCGTTGQWLQLEAMKVRLTEQLATKMDVWYRVYSAHVGWSGWASNGDPAGTEGLSYRAEAVEIRYLPRGTAAPGSTLNALRVG